MRVAPDRSFSLPAVAKMRWRLLLFAPFRSHSCKNALVIAPFRSLSLSHRVDGQPDEKRAVFPGQRVRRESGTARRFSVSNSGRLELTLRANAHRRTIWRSFRGFSGQKMLF